MLPRDNRRNAWPIVKVHWSESQVCFDCPCGRAELFVDDEPETCDGCGRVYRLSSDFTVQEPSDDRHTDTDRGARR